LSKAPAPPGQARLRAVHRRSGASKPHFCVRTHSGASLTCRRPAPRIAAAAPHKAIIAPFQYTKHHMRSRPAPPWRCTHQPLLLHKESMHGCHMHKASGEGALLPVGRAQPGTTGIAPPGHEHAHAESRHYGHVHLLKQESWRQGHRCAGHAPGAPWEALPRQHKWRAPHATGCTYRTPKLACTPQTPKLACKGHPSPTATSPGAAQQRACMSNP